MGSNSSWQTSWSSQFSDHSRLDLMIIDPPSKCARSLVALRLLSAAALGTPVHGRADFQKWYKVTGLIYATSPGSKSLVSSPSDAKAKSTWTMKANEKEKARQGCGNHLDISRVQFFKSGMGVQQGWVLFWQLCKRPLFEDLCCQLSIPIVYNLQNLRFLHTYYCLFHLPQFFLRESVQCWETKRLQALRQLLHSTHCTFL